jgi:DNA (cytosine-5)-methyltransferase 1
MRRLRAVDLFCGCGGLTDGLKQAGFRVIGALDLDPLAVESYKLNHRATRVWQADIRSVSVAGVMRELKLEAGQLDLLAGCPPCQAFSALRTLNGSRVVRDRGKDLVFEFLRFVRVLAPKAIMMENVPGLSEDRRMRQLLKALDDLGYESSHDILDAADYGVPQRRRRLILVAGRYGAIEFAKATVRRVTVRDAIGHLPRPGLSGDPLHDLPENRRDNVERLIAQIPRNGGSRSDLGRSWQLACHRSCDGFSDIYGRMSWDDVAPTITSGCVNPSKGRFLHPRQNRCITVREAALLQTFRPSYKLSLRRGKFEAARLIGNALPPEFIRRHASVIKRHLVGRDSLHNSSSGR